MYIETDIHTTHLVEFGKIHNVSTLAEQVGESNNKYTGNYILVQISRHTLM